MRLGGRNNPKIVENNAFDVENGVFDVENLVFEIENIVFDVENVVFDVVFDAENGAFAPTFGKLSYTPMCKSKT